MLGPVNDDESVEIFTEALNCGPITFCGTQWTSLFVNENGYVTFGSAGGIEEGVSMLQVHEVGDYEASYVPTLADFHRLDPRFRMADEIWRRCNACSSPIELGAIHWVCSVSTCNRKRTGMVFCSVDCWEIHLSDANHREAWAVESRRHECDNKSPLA